MRPAFHRGALFTAPVVAAIVLMTWAQGEALAQDSLSLDLDKAVHMATAHNRKTKMREDEADAAVYRRKQATGRFLPKLSLYARYSRVSHVEPGSLSLPAPTIPGQPAVMVATVDVDHHPDGLRARDRSFAQPRPAS